MSYLDFNCIKDVFGSIPGVECNKPIPGLNETSFVDDGAQTLIADAKDIVDSAREAISIIDFECSRFGLVLVWFLLILKVKRRLLLSVKVLCLISTVLSCWSSLGFEQFC